MVKYKSDYDYYRLVEDILENDEFGKIGEIKQHGMTRLEHSLRVSYYSYQITKKLGLHYQETARAGLLHDFFENSVDTSKKGKAQQFVNHPKEAADNAKKYFEINDLEEDIIKCHMFPSNTLVPKYMESWVVNFVDKTVATYEFGKSFSYKFSYLTNFYLILLLNFLK
ncbi:MAG: HD domain-containing protein [Firmicutes bacterium]|nr:HD domain-containing protein [Bacillota bacterium]